MIVVRAAWMLLEKLEAMCSTIKSSLGIDKFYFANQDLLAVTY